ncbi:MAG: hypothetical protein JKX73_10515 [Flavobacteriales bacterium]|nr:hypothetical protein [Flavobacteriales bacterium]
MKKALLISCIISISLLSFTTPELTPVLDFCTQLKTMLDAAKDGFAPIKGEATTRMITGHEKKFYVANLKFVDNQTCYINDVASYPECECILETDTRITESLSAAYNSYKKQISDCLGEEWVIMEQDSSNNYYLKGTKYKKLVVRENISGKKVKFHLYIYSSMIEKKRVVELKFEGIGKK